MLKTTVQRARTKMYLRPPSSYYGGKQLLLSRLLPLIPTHLKYTESFIGGGALYWTKPPSDIEVINDFDGFVSNFYFVFKTQFQALKSLVAATPYSRQSHDDAIIMRQYAHLFSPVQRAWAFYFMCNTSMFSILENQMNTPSKDNKPLRSFHNKVALLENNAYVERLKNTMIESRDAFYVITRHDSEDTFHFVDPPYFNSDCGHYAGYSADDFKKLLDVLAAVKGKFLLTCYPSDIVDTYILAHGWHIERVEMLLNAGNKGKKKVECLVRNYAV